MQENGKRWSVETGTRGIGLRLSASCSRFSSIRWTAAFRSGGCVGKGSWAASGVRCGWIFRMRPAGAAVRLRLCHDVAGIIPMQDNGKRWSVETGTQGVGLRLSASCSRFSSIRWTAAFRGGGTAAGKGSRVARGPVRVDIPDASGRGGEVLSGTELHFGISGRGGVPRSVGRETVPSCGVSGERGKSRSRTGAGSFRPYLRVASDCLPPSCRCGRQKDGVLVAGAGCVQSGRCGRACRVRVPDVSRFAGLCPVVLLVRPGRSRQK